MMHCSSPSNERSKLRSGDTAGVFISKYSPGWKKRPKNRIAFITAPMATAAANTSMRMPVGIAKVAVERTLRGLPDLPDRSSHRAPWSWPTGSAYHSHAIKTIQARSCPPLRWNLSLGGIRVLSAESKPPVSIKRRLISIPGEGIIILWAVEPPPPALWRPGITS